MIRNLLLLTLVLLVTSSLKAQNDGTKIVIKTTFGDMVAVLYDDTPLHRDNFIKNIKNGTYQGALLHRVIYQFMAQGGNPASINAANDVALSRDECGTIKNEIRGNHFHKKGALSAARLPDAANPERESSACQFFIVQGFKHNDAQLNAMENENYRFPDVNRATYKVMGGYPALDMQYTVFGEIISGLEIIDLIHAMPTGYYASERPNTDIKFTIEIME